MSNIKLARVDDRLIHGQVVTNWVQHINAKRIIIVDDVTANDDFTSRVIAMAAPQEVEIDIYTTDQAIEELQVDPKHPTMLLAKNPGVYLDLVNNDVDISAVNLGGMGASADREKFYKNISAGPQEKEDIKELLEKNVSVNVQIISSDNAVKVTEEMISN